MSYTETVRHLMCETELKKSCCAKAELSAYCELYGNKYIVKAADRELSKRIFFLCRKITGRRPSVALSRDKVGRIYYQVYIPANVCYESSFFSSKLDDCCIRAYLRGCFLASGTISSPEKSSAYIELYQKTEQGAAQLHEILAGYDIKSGVTKRRDKFVVYIKNFEGICDFLILTGAQRAMFEFQEKKVDREINNNVNRALNCDMANIDRTMESGAKEAEVIKLMKESGRINALPEQLLPLATLRLSNPMLSLSELGNLLDPPLSKSGVSHRMKKIMEFAEPVQ